MTQPIVFEPIPMERVWGGRRFESLKGKALPHGTPIGELWEIVDREDAQSVVHSGPLAGRTLHDLWVSERAAIFGNDYLDDPSPRFPLLVKLLDARERLSVQVHPPAHMAATLQGEPKTEVWYFLDALPGARIYAGLKNGITRETFDQLLRAGGVESALHEISVETGESIFIPSGRLHAIGEGNLIVEVQQNSDTTYRVFDWNRTGLDGRPRALHIDQSLASIDFDDFEPPVAPKSTSIVADCPYFRVEKVTLDAPRDLRPPGRFALITPVEGAVRCGGFAFERGQFFLVPAEPAGLAVEPDGNPASVLVSTLPV
ncbi:MAG: type I phosphomannose isomerase catalytic subunit [Terrimicrobiaceae bacterium]|nr:type I phosphomannose isomerase catalytic subunit [Terrimicrobiaceae bacterium]